jgi:hypothetical protein
MGINATNEVAEKVAQVLIESIKEVEKEIVSSKM